jgi:hypothetical protein
VDKLSDAHSHGHSHALPNPEKKIWNGDSEQRVLLLVSGRIEKMLCRQDADFFECRHWASAKL